MPLTKWPKTSQFHLNSHTSLTPKKSTLLKSKCFMLMGKRVAGLREHSLHSQSLLLIFFMDFGIFLKYKLESSRTKLFLLNLWLCLIKNCQWKCLTSLFSNNLWMCVYPMLRTVMWQTFTGMDVALLFSNFVFKVELLIMILHIEEVS